MDTSPLSIRFLLVLVLLGGCERRGEQAAPAPKPPPPVAPAPQEAAGCAVPSNPLARPLPEPPSTVRDAGRALTELLSEEAKAFLRCEADVERAVAVLHFPVGRQLRNGWIRPSGGAALRADATQLGVADPDGISGAILVTAHAALRPAGGDPGKAIASYLERRGAAR